MSDKNVLIQVKDLKKAFGANQVLDGITTDICQGEVVAIIGPSGSGKSTFLRSLNLLEIPTGGQILFEGTDITDPKVDINRHRQKIGMVFQQFNLFPHKTVKENIMLAPVELKLMTKEEASKKADELLDKAERFRSYWGKEGGITVSGGEALLQIDFLIDLFRKAHERGINTNLDTSGQPFTREEPFFSKFNELLKYTDLVMLDIKHIDDEEHKKLTGHTNKNILDCARYLSEQGIPMWIRHVLVPGITDNDEYLKKTREFIDTLDTVMKVEVLPYHTLGEYKWKELGIPYKLEGVEPPTEERIQNAKKILEFNKYK